MNDDDRGQGWMPDICSADQGTAHTDLDTRWSAVDHAGVHLLTREDAGYPAALAQIPRRHR